MKVTKQQYNAAVNKGKFLATQAKNIYYQLAETALSVCDVSVGGQGKYSLNKYAKDVGVNHSSLQTWVREYKNVVSKLSKKETEKLDRSAVREVLARSNKDTSKKDIKELYSKAKKERETPEDLQLVEDCKRMKNIVFHVRDSWALNRMNKERLLELSEYSSIICKAIKAKGK